MPIIISIFLVIGSLPPFGIPYTGLFFLIPLLLNRHNSKPALVAQDGFLFALIIGAYMYFGAWSYDIYAYLGITLLFTAAFSIFIYVSFLIITFKTVYAVMLLPLSWVFIELTFNFFHLPLTLSIFLTPTPTLLAPAQYGGQYLVSMLLVGFQVSIIVFLNQYAKGKYNNSANNIFRVTIIPLLYCFMFFLSDNPSLNTELVNISILQTNAHPRNTQALASDNMIEGLHQYRKDLLTSTINATNKPDLLVWPEVSLSKYEFRNNNNISQAAALLSVNMLVASPDLSPSGASYNSVFSISSTGKILQRYTKHIPIPLIEDVAPAESQWLPHKMLPGSPGSIICYESAFSRPVVKLAAAGAGFIALSTNDAYAGPSILPYIHLQFSRLRAVETGKTVLRAANGGPSAVITADGRVHNTLDLYTTGVIQTSVKPNYELTFYTKYYDIIIATYWLLSILAITIIAVSLLRLSLHHSLKQTLSPARIVIATVTLSTSLVFQYLYISNVYQINSGKLLPETFVNFQEGHISDTLSYSQLKADTPVDSLLSSITYLLRDYGNNLNLSSIRKLIARTDENTDTDIETFMAGFNYSIDFNNLNTGETFTTAPETTPYLALLTSGETVVINDFTDKQVVFFSPYYGKRMAVKTKAFIDKWTGRTISIFAKEKPWDI